MYLLDRPYLSANGDEFDVFSPVETDTVFGGLCGLAGFAGEVAPIALGYDVEEGEE